MKDGFSSNLLFDDKDAKSTKRATKSVFHQYLKKKKAEKPQTKDTLANVLKRFFAEARKTDGTSYSKSILNSLRFGLNRHFIATRGFDVFKIFQSLPTQTKCLARSAWT